MAIIRYKTGEVLTPKQVKAEIQAIKGWTTAQYQREYDKFRNKVRNYETVSGVEKGKYKVQELFYEKTKAEKRYGANYKPSGLLAAINRTSSSSPGRVKRFGDELTGISQKAQAREVNAIKDRFSTLLKSNYNGVADKVKDVTDPAEALRILRETADDLKTYKEAEAKKHGFKDSRTIGTP
ncbi:MAG: hypothetical protein MR643_04820 [Clostridiales bacterium]|nr:hypothetical protein [Clostridiales bacterium]